ncbi:MAG: hypothetical protein GQ557_00375 [Mycoplasmataceae bacterium]|nr:hypothetical protein [Mycoplasmataceae bacterium]
MYWAWYIPILFFLALLQFTASFAFNFKIYKITKNKFVDAAFLGMLATIVSAIAIPFIAYLAITIANVGVDGETVKIGAAIGIVIAGAFSAAIGNFISVMLVPKVLEWQKNKNNQKENIKKESN